ncbi:hypothetical protein [Bradyrhizobium nanningense]|uniref:hypothetical protein n=1 Tax=Bradyrhizobium nanningense TaxID=1325118 RepID=UPI0010087A00|nr:hypothetical protein [Bradyrhizobium nanningense]
MTPHAPDQTPETQCGKDGSMSPPIGCFASQPQYQRQQLYLGQASAPLSQEVTVRNLMHSIQL